MKKEKPQITALLAMLVLLCAGRDIVAEVDRIELEKMRKKKKLQHSKEMREFARWLAEHAELTHFIRGLDIEDEDEGRLF